MPANDRVRRSQSNLSALDGAVTHRPVRANALIRLGVCSYFLGGYVSAVRDLESGLAEAHGLALQGDVAYAHMTLAAVAMSRGDAAVAQRRLADTLTIGTAIGKQTLVAPALYDLAWIASSWGDYAECTRLV